MKKDPWYYTPLSDGALRMNTVCVQNSILNRVGYFFNRRLKDCEKTEPIDLI